MALIQNEDNKCPTTKQVNDALKSMGGVQTLVLTTQDLIYPGRSSNIEVNSADSAVMEIVKSNMTDMFCLNEAAKDADVSPYMKSDEFEVTIGNLREYQE